MTSAEVRRHRTLHALLDMVEDMQRAPERQRPMVFWVEKIAWIYGEGEPGRITRVVPVPEDGENK